MHFLYVRNIFLFCDFCKFNLLRNAVVAGKCIYELETSPPVVMPFTNNWLTLIFRNFKN